MLRLERSTIDYLAGHPSDTTMKMFPAERATLLPQPFSGQLVQPEHDLSKPACVFELRNIDFWARYGGSVVTADNALLADISPEVWGVENHPIFSTFRLPKSRPLSGRTAILVTPEARENYYHWLIDLLPRALLLKRARAGFEAFDHILINGSPALYEEPSLLAVGLPLNKLIYAGANDRFRIERAIIPSMDHLSKVVALWKVRELRGLRDEFLASCLPEPPSVTPKKIYISRKHASVRRLLNESELLPLLKDAGFAIIELESLPWPEQVRLFSNAEILLAPHGAGFASIVFCKPNTVVTEIVTRAGYLDFYLHLAASAGLRYHFLEAHPRVSGRPGSVRALENEDMILDERVLQRFLNQL